MTDGVTNITLGELFAGVGGFSVGFERAGFQTLWQVEWDKHCQSVLERHWPHVVRYGDVADVNGADIDPVDVITFGSPCQDLSIGGKRAGLAGQRSGLFFQAIRIIKEMQDATNAAFPRAVIWENVPGALSSNQGADFQVVLEALADLGCYHLEWHCLDARWFGVPQRRRRIFVTAIFDSAAAERCGSQIFPVSPRSGWNPPSGPTTRPDIASALTKSFGTGGPDAAHAAAGWLIPQAYVKVIRPQTSEHPEVWREEETAPTINKFDMGESRATVLAIPHVRRLTPLECERLMSLDDDHTRWRADGTEQADSHRYQQCGNGVVVNVTNWLAKHLARVL